MKRQIKFPEDKIKSTDPIRWNMCKYIRGWEGVEFGFRHPTCVAFSKAETEYAIAVLLKLDRAPDYIHVCGGSEWTRPRFVFSFMIGEDIESYDFEIPSVSFISDLIPKLDNPGGAAMYIDNFLREEI